MIARARAWASRRSRRGKPRPEYLVVTWRANGHTFGEPKVVPLIRGHARASSDLFGHLAVEIELVELDEP